MRKLVVLAAAALFAATATADVIATDPAGDGFGIGIMDLLQLEASNTATDLVLTLTINGDITTDWGKYCMSIDTDAVSGSGGMSMLPPGADANPWARDIAIGNAQHLAEFWVGSWVDGPGGVQLWNWNGSAWNTGGSPGMVRNPGPTSTIVYTFPLVDLGVGVGDTIFLEAFSTGGNNNDTAVDTVNAPADDWNPPAGDWGADAYVANSTPYTLVPEPSAIALLVLGGVALLRRR